MDIKLKPMQSTEKLVLSLQASQAFMEALLDTSQPNDAMKKAAQLYNKINGNGIS